MEGGSRKKEDVEEERKKKIGLREMASDSYTQISVKEEKWRRRKKGTMRKKEDKEKERKHVSIRYTHILMS